MAKQKKKTNLWNPNNLDSDSQPLLSFAFHSKIIIIKILRLSVLSSVAFSWAITFFVCSV